MKFIRLLQEASELPLSELKKAMQKDKRVAPALKAAQLTPDQVTDKKAFLSTLKFFVFNNPNVRQFVDSRHNVKDLWKEDFRDLAKLMPSDLDGDKAQRNLDEIQDFLKRLFREHTHVSGGGMSKELRDALEQWFNSNRGRHDLHARVQRELMSLPDVRPSKKVLVYRGLLFSEYSLVSRERYDGTLEVGNGLKFLRSIRANKRVVDLSWEYASSWTKSREVAERFAMYGPASSHFGAMMQWFDRAKKERAIDGQLGFVISTLADPEDVLLDSDRFNARFHMKHGDEGEVILKPGNYTCRVVKKFTQAGEVPPEEQATQNSELQDALTAATTKAPRIKIDAELADAVNNLWTTDGFEIFARNPKAFKRLALNSTTTELLHAYDKVRDFFNEHLAQLDKADIRLDGAETDEAMQAKIKALKEVYDSLKHTVKSVHLRSEKNPDGRGARHQLTGEQLRSNYSMSTNGLERDLAQQGYVRFFNRENGRNLKRLAQALNVPSGVSPQMLGAPKQKEFLDKLSKAFYSKLGVDAPDNTPDAVKGMVNLLRKVERNKYMHDIVANLSNNLQIISNDTPKND
jgi:hypothetical protein